MDLKGLKYLIVGAGFYGAVIAERIANELEENVLVIDLRGHLGGNAYSYKDRATNIEVHKYGSHIFHTSNESVWNYISRFTKFNTYKHRVMTQYRDRIYSMPINLMTINSFFGKSLSPAQAKELIEKEVRREGIVDPKNLEEKAISLIGRSLYEAFVRGYTQKQWETPLTDLPANIITRLPVRYNYNDFYFNDTYEGIPVDGYGAIFEKMLHHPKIDVQLGVDYFAMKETIPPSCKVIYTGPVDRLFDFKFGRLGWRTTDFVEERHHVSDYQGNSVMNYADVDVPYTRIHEFKHYHPEREQAADQTLVFKEYSRSARPEDTPYYPINTPRDREIFQLYQAEAAKLDNLILGGRLGNYVYVDMHQAIAMALNTFASRIRPQTLP